MPGRVPLHGYNTNYRKQGEVFHIQTEDLGEPRNAIVTQVFTGGTIHAKKRSTYDDILDREDFEPLLRARMQQQHKMLLIALRDDKLDEINAAEAAATAAKPSAPAAPPPLPAQEAPATVEAPPSADVAPLSPPAQDTMRDTVQMELPPEFYQEIVAGAPDEDGIIIEDLPPAETPIPPTIPKEPPPAPRLEPVPDEIPAPPVRVSPPPIQASSLDGLELPSAASPPPITAREQQPRPKAMNRPAPRKARPASSPPKSSRRPRIFAEISKPTKGFGEEQVGERSLDEVILSYLADDLQDD